MIYSIIFPAVFIVPILSIITFKIKRLVLAVFFGNIFWIFLLIIYIIYRERLDYATYYFEMLISIVIVSVTLSIIRISLHKIRKKREIKSKELKIMEINDL